MTVSFAHSHRKRWLGRVSRFGSFVPKRGTIATRIARDRDLDRYIWRSQTTSIGVPKSIRSTYQNGSVQRTKVKRYGVPKWSGTFFDSVVRRKEMGDAFSKGNNMGAVYFCFGNNMNFFTLNPFSLLWFSRWCFSGGIYVEGEKMMKKDKNEKRLKKYLMCIL